MLKSNSFEGKNVGEFYTPSYIVCKVAVLQPGVMAACLCRVLVLCMSFA